jgi:hypothetical protein
MEPSFKEFLSQFAKRKVNDASVLAKEKMAGEWGRRRKGGH